MALTNAEKQARWRERQRHKMADAQHLLEAVGDGDPMLQIIKLKKQLAEEKERTKDLRETLQAREALERANAAVVHKHSGRAMFAEADKERLQAEVDELTEENEALRAEQLRNDDDDLIDDDTPLRLPGERERQRIYDAATEGVRSTVDAFLSLKRKERPTAWQLINLYDQLGGRPVSSQAA